MTDGDFKYPIKYNEPVRPKNAVIIICSNVPPEKYYAATCKWNDDKTNMIIKNEEYMDKFLARFNVLNLE